MLSGAVHSNVNVLLLAPVVALSLVGGLGTSVKNKSCSKFAE